MIRTHPRVKFHKFEIATAPICAQVFPPAYLHDAPRHFAGLIAYIYVYARGYISECAASCYFACSFHRSGGRTDQRYKYAQRTCMMSFLPHAPGRSFLIGHGITHTLAPPEREDRSFFPSLLSTRKKSIEGNINR